MLIRTQEERTFGCVSCIHRITKTDGTNTVHCTNVIKTQHVHTHDSHYYPSSREEQDK